MLLVLITLFLIILINEENVEARHLSGGEDKKLQSEMLDLKNKEKKFTELTELSISYVKEKTSKKNSENEKNSDKKDRTWFDKCDDRCRTSRKLRLLLEKKKKDTAIDQLFRDLFS